jgi:hypothetical protein
MESSKVSDFLIGGAPFRAEGELTCKVNVKNL